MKKKLSTILALLLILAFSMPVMAMQTDAIVGTTPKEVNVIGHYLGSFGKDGEETGIFINLYESDKEVKALVDTYPLPENKLGIASKFIANASIESGGKVKLYGKELLEKKDGVQLLNINFTLVKNVGVGEVNYLNNKESLPLKMIMQNDENKPSEWAKINYYNAIADGLVPLKLQMNPRNPIKRGEFSELAVDLLMKVENKSFKELEEKAVKENTSPITFSDTKNPYILLASRLGIVKGYEDGKFMADSEITREEAAVLLDRLINLITKGDLVVTMEYVVFNDENKVSDWAKNSVQLVSKVGNESDKIMNGVGEGKFDPKGKYTIEQSVLTMQRIEKLVK